MSDGLESSLCPWTSYPLGILLGSSILHSVRLLIPLGLWCLSGSTAAISSKEIDTSGSFDEERPLLDQRAPQVIDTSNFLNPIQWSLSFLILTALVEGLVTLILSASSSSVPSTTFLLESSVLQLGWISIWCLLRFLDYGRKTQEERLTTLRQLSGIHTRSVRVLRGTWFGLLLEGYHYIQWTLHPDWVCPGDIGVPRFLSVSIWIFLALRAVGLVILSLSLIPQSRRVSELTYEALSPELKYKPPTSFAEFSMHFAKLIPFMWPKSGPDAWKLRAYMVSSFAIMVLGRGANLLVPIQYKRVVDALGGLSGTGSTNLSLFSYLTPTSFAPDLPYADVLLFVALRFLAGSSGVLQSLQAFLWIPVGQYTTRQISVEMLRHLHNLSLGFHLNRKTGEILRVQDKAVASIVSLLTSIIFNILPTISDIAIACFFFTFQFDAVFGTIVFITMGAYILSTIIITEWRTQYRKRANELDNAMEAKAVDSLLNFETVKYYNAEEFEVQCYNKAVCVYQQADFVSSVTLWVLDGVQNVIVQVGLLCGCLLCAKRIMIDQTMTVGDFVLYLSYITQLYGPLNWFGNYYRVIQKNMVDMERMLDIFQVPEEVKDAADAKELFVTRGHIVFDNVSFTYDARKQTVQNVSFEVLPGTTTAFVGTSGGGKSTLGRLLFRFYDVADGSVKIDGQDIKQVTHNSLRQSIGVVPQDTVLFNETIRYNIMYAKPDATEEEFLEATKAAQIHEKIMAFPDGYSTQVGERGLRLSGGEKQRVAIARTLLKDPPILLLDEATSALDTHSESALQKALLNKPRTTLVIAHRLSTIAHAEQIIVFKDGKIVEKGRHDFLMKRKGEYYSMWNKQLKDEHGN